MINNQEMQILLADDDPDDRIFLWKPLVNPTWILLFMR